MKVLLINGSPNERGCTYTALAEVSATLNKRGIGTEILYLGKKPIAGCIACGNCFKTHKCVFNDQVNEVSEKLDENGGQTCGGGRFLQARRGECGV